MLMTTSEQVAGKRVVRSIGLVWGSVVRTRHIGRDILAGLKNLVGGEVKGYTELLDRARQEAIYRMEEQARRMGANAVVGVRFATSQLMQGAAEVLVYGTAVVIEDDQEPGTGRDLPAFS